MQGGVHQLVEVAAAIFRFIGAGGDQLRQVTALLHHPLHQLGWRGLGGTRLQVVDQLTELQQPLGGATAQGAHRLGIAHHLPQRNAQLVGRVSEALNRGLADAALGGVQHPQQADGVGRVYKQLEVSEHILDLAAVVEAQAAHHDVGNAPAHQ